MEILQAAFIDMPIYMWNGDWLSKTGAVVWSLVVLATVLFCLFLVYLIVDRTFLSYMDGVAKVVGKEYCPAHTQTYVQTVTIGSSTTMIPQTHNIPESYNLCLQVNDLNGWMQVTKEFYERTPNGERVSVKYSKRRLSNALSFK